MLIMTSGRNALIRTAFETNRDVLRSQLAKLEPSDEAGRPGEALALALSLLLWSAVSVTIALTVTLPSAEVVLSHEAW